MVVNLQYLRALAALMVVVFHATDDYQRLGERARLPHFEMGAAGIDIFFVISGFIIWVTTDGFAVSPGSFFVNRVRRIVPLYWIMTLLLAGVAIVLPAVLDSTVFNLGHLVGSLFFVPVLHPIFGIYKPVVFVGWTLNYEMAFYALFALGLFLPRRWRLAAVTGVLAATWLAGVVFEPEGVTGFYTHPIILEFAAGMLTGAAFTSRLQVPVAASVSAVAAGTVLLVLLHSKVDGMTMAGVPAALVVFGAAFAEKRAGTLTLAPLRLLGDASYSIYLTHVFTLPVFQLVWARLDLPASGAMAFAYLAAATLASTLGGVLTYRLLEVPLAAVLPRTKRAEPLPTAQNREWRGARAQSRPL